MVVLIAYHLAGHIVSVMVVVKEYEYGGCCSSLVIKHSVEDALEHAWACRSGAAALLAFPTLPDVVHCALGRSAIFTTLSHCTHSTAER